MTAPNRNLLWATIFMDELARCGVRDVIVAPGSRSTPLVFAASEHPLLRVHSIIDERGAAFFALGMGLVTGIPAVVLCTSGTAAANFYPAVIEAKLSGVPLIVVTADRSHELRDSGANQTIDQVKLFGSHVLWAYDAALPESQPPALARRNLRTLAARSVALSTGLTRGPVHLNFPFRKPLEPTAVEADLHEDDTGRPDMLPFTQIVPPELHPDFVALDWLEAELVAAERPVIVCGPRCERDEFPLAVKALALRIGAPVLADALSGVRFSVDRHGVIISTYETILNAASVPPPDFILQFGGPVTSQALDEYLSSANATRVNVQREGRWQDPHHQSDLLIIAEAARLCDYMQTIQRDDAWLKQWQQAEHDVSRLLDETLQTHWFDGAVARNISHLLPYGAPLVLASSLSVRHFDQFSLRDGTHLTVYANRGASGIDGTLSTAAGVGKASEERVTLLAGDLAAIHDLNGLMAFGRTHTACTLVVVNNDGGGIFQRLPIAQFDPPYHELFVTPHGLNFAGAAQMFGFRYALANDAATFEQMFKDSHASDQNWLIEVPTDIVQDLAARQAVMQVVETGIMQREYFTQGEA
ncbi:MAG: 2-succinyl-5-enolpyruvyl-6-hydroxy-3-cyclohexene-1-carboxylic-acid synthase [Pleurocapsa minor GSE-CHR-MK-17-07R]|jgi:2-succinyl-5-enolpyruvyl-6-hydroxy-3-cyclohexene-1-carboxylate synthase|nr:2-succinyl-5-enolpyruvyl-6-hydroxy-3-cyclohexene-1-carboxylic-acid synthase [Pleurocapsa minor GSE-CHR-MK 17-07R]